MMYYKIINDRMVFSTCQTIQTNGGVWISNPTAEQIADAGWQVYVPPVVPQEEPDYDAVVGAVKKLFNTEIEALTDEEALEVAALFPTWHSKIGEAVAVNERLWYNTKLYKVIQAHTVQAEWTPVAAPSLFVEVSFEEWPEWRQPQGSADAYMTGDKVTHNALQWVSDLDNNVWEPGIYGWSQR